MIVESQTQSIYDTRPAYTFSVENFIPIGAAEGSTSNSEPSSTPAFGLFDNGSAPPSMRAVAVAVAHQTRRREQGERKQ